MKKKSFAAGVAAGGLGLLLALLLLALVMVYTGSYNIAATEDHSPLARWGFETAMHNSIQRRAADIEAPEFTDEMVAAGAREYKAMCEHCHGGPGVEPEAWSRGMLPQPPHLHEVIEEWEAREVFWLVRHGAKMTGMPAFGQDHDDDTVWEIAAFATRLPAMTDEEYARHGGAQGHEHTTGGH